MHVYYESQSHLNSHYTQSTTQSATCSTEMTLLSLRTCNSQSDAPLQQEIDDLFSPQAGGNCPPWMCNYFTFVCHLLCQHLCEGVMLEHACCVCICVCAYGCVWFLAYLSYLVLVLWPVLTLHVQEVIKISSSYWYHTAHAHVCEGSKHLWVLRSSRIDHAWILGDRSHGASYMAQEYKCHRKLASTVYISGQGCAWYHKYYLASYLQ